ncbi:uncharacterized protein LOC127383688 [Apus apus]|uniref:uncharacterized protein LOC127383688 n=1 Tax=Apus apus TaxID=8895 RepID=UPI0021F8D491|nr:uncharacterized protein LOC127383688 [Apus apus]
MDGASWFVGLFGCSCSSWATLAGARLHLQAQLVPASSVFWAPVSYRTSPVSCLPAPLQSQLVSGAPTRPSCLHPLLSCSSRPVWPQGPAPEGSSLFAAPGPCGSSSCAASGPAHGWCQLVCGSVWLQLQLMGSSGWSSFAPSGPVGSCFQCVLDPSWFQNQSRVISSSLAASPLPVGFQLLSIANWVPAHLHCQLVPAHFHG